MRQNPGNGIISGPSKYREKSIGMDPRIEDDASFKYKGYPLRDRSCEIYAGGGKSRVTAAIPSNSSAGCVIFDDIYRDREAPCILTRGSFSGG